MSTCHVVVAATLVAGLRAALLLVAVVHHGTEVAAVDGVAGPLLAAALDPAGARTRVRRSSAR